MNNYDKIYPYDKLLQEIKELIIPTIIDKVNPKDYRSTGLSKEALAEVVYTQIMGLVYNDFDINATLSDLMPSRNHIIYSGTDESDAANMSLHLVMIQKDYQHQVWAFQKFHKLTQELKPQKEIIIEVKKHLLASKLGF